MELQIEQKKPEQRQFERKEGTRGVTYAGSSQSARRRRPRHPLRHFRPAKTTLNIATQVKVPCLMKPLIMSYRVRVFSSIALEF